MKKTYLLAYFLIITSTVRAQWDETQSGKITTSDNVGIGTTNPDTKLHIEGTNSTYSRIANSSGNTQLTFGAVTGRNIIYSQDYSGAPQTLKLQINNENNFVIGTNGNIGIGTSSPNYHFHAIGSDRARFEQTEGIIDLVAYGSSGNDFDNTAGLFVSNRSALVMTGLSGSGDIKFITRPSSYLERMTIKSNGNVGIGTSTPNYHFHVVGSDRARFQQTEGTIDLVAYGTSGNDFDNTAGLFVNDKTTLIMTGLTGSGDIKFVTRPSGYTERMVIKSNGKIGIGTSTPDSDALLTVKGRIHSSEIKVLANAGVPDYVFEEDYELRTLQKTKEYIQENKHLPEIPSAAEIGENGIDLGDMNMRLLKKIEELTLYQIKLLERLEKAEDKIQQLEKE